MTVINGGLVATVSSVSFQKEALALRASSGDGLFNGAAPCSASLRGNMQDSWKKPSMPRTSRISNSFSRLRVRAKQADSGTVRSVAVRVGHELINAGHRYLDVRTHEEFNRGHVKGAVNVPYLVKAGDGMSKNAKFLEVVEKEFGKDDEIIVGCQSGRRSIMAAAELREANFTGVTDLGGGFLAWKESGLPVDMPRQA